MMLAIMGLADTAGDLHYEHEALEALASDGQAGFGIFGHLTELDEPASHRALRGASRKNVNMHTEIGHVWCAAPAIIGRSNTRKVPFQRDSI